MPHSKGSSPVTRGHGPLPGDWECPVAAQPDSRGGHRGRVRQGPLRGSAEPMDGFDSRGATSVVQLVQYNHLRQHPRTALTAGGMTQRMVPFE